jgi:hypothetical protein
MPPARAGLSIVAAGDLAGRGWRGADAGRLACHARPGAEWLAAAPVCAGRPRIEAPMVQARVRGTCHTRPGEQRGPCASLL